MTRRAKPARNGTAATFAIPTMIALATTVALAAGLVGDGLWDVIAWSGLASGPAIVALAWRGRS